MMTDKIDYASPVQPKRGRAVVVVSLALGIFALIMWVGVHELDVWLPDNSPDSFGLMAVFFLPCTGLSLVASVLAVVGLFISRGSRLAWLATALAAAPLIMLAVDYLTA